MKGKWILVEPTDCFTFAPVYECSKCKKNYHGYYPEPICKYCGSKNKINAKKYIKKAILKDLKEVKHE